MYRTLLILPLLALGYFCIAQPQYPTQITTALDSLFSAVYEHHQKKDTPGIYSTLDKVNKLIAPVEKDYLLFTGVVRLYQSYYSIHSDPAKYMAQGVRLLKGSRYTISDSFPTQFLQLVEFFRETGRMKEWLPADSVLRESVLEKNSESGYRYALTNYAGKKLSEKQYSISKNMALYDKIVLEYQKPKDIYGKITIVYNEWLALKGDYIQWADMPYDKRNIKAYEGYGQITPAWAGNKPEYEWLRNIDFKKQFISLIGQLKKLRKELVDDNPYGSKSFEQNYRNGYYATYVDILDCFYNWAIRDHKQSAVILPLKEFLFRDLLPFETDAAARVDSMPVVNGIGLGNIFSNLSMLYYYVGNGEESREIAMQGQEYINNYKRFTTDERIVSLYNLINCIERAFRLEGKYSEAMRALNLLKKYSPKPDSLNKSTIRQFDNFSLIRLEEVEILAARQLDGDANNLLGQFLDTLNTIKFESEDFFYQNTTTWPQIQFLVATQKAKMGTWMNDLIRESMDDLENERTHLDIFYPTMLLLFKSQWHTNKYFSKGSLSNLLFFTGRQLQDNFILLSPEDRMRLYEQRLSGYFDVYHELLFSGKLDSFPELKEKVIAQSLHLKNALADGNLLPDELLTGGTSDSLALDIAERARGLRQETNLRLHRTKIRKFSTDDAKEDRDQLQSIWLSILSGPGMDSLVRLPDWKQLSRRLKAGQLYLETVRYTSWLSDSSAKYGAYLVSPDGKLHIIPLYREDSLVKLLKDPASSPQTASLNNSVNRGAKIEKTSQVKSFKPGDKDKLGELILSPLWKYIGAGKELLVVSDGLLNRISMAALQWQNKYLLQYMQLRQLSGNYMLSAKKAVLPAKSKALLSGGLDYSATPSIYNRNRLFVPELSWQFLPGTKQEVQQLQPLFKNAGIAVTVSGGASFPDSLRKNLEGYQFIHLATHGFYFDTSLASQYYSKRWNSEAVRYEPLYRCGIALSNANNPDSTGSLETDGYLLGYEIANTDLRNCYLISLSACETGLGDLRNNLGVDGLSRALKLGGARHLLITLWKVPDQPTAVFMQQFYKELFSGKTPAAALQATQLLMSKTYKATDWGAFILVE